MIKYLKFIAYSIFIYLSINLLLILLLYANGYINILDFSKLTLTEASSDFPRIISRLLYLSFMAYNLILIIGIVFFKTNKIESFFKETKNIFIELYKSSLEKKKN